MRGMACRIVTRTNHGQFGRGGGVGLTLNILCSGPLLHFRAAFPEAQPSPMQLGLARSTFFINSNLRSHTQIACHSLSSE